MTDRQVIWLVAGLCLLGTLIGSAVVMHATREPPAPVAALPPPKQAVANPAAKPETQNLKNLTDSIASPRVEKRPTLKVSYAQLVEGINREFRLNPIQRMANGEQSCLAVSDKFQITLHLMGELDDLTAIHFMVACDENDLDRTLAMAGLVRLMMNIEPQWKDLVYWASEQLKSGAAMRDPAPRRVFKDRLVLSMVFPSEPPLWLITMSPESLDREEYRTLQR